MRIWGYQIAHNICHFFLRVLYFMTQNRLKVKTKRNFSIPFLLYYLQLQISFLQWALHRTSKDANEVIDIFELSQSSDRNEFWNTTNTMCPSCPTSIFGIYQHKISTQNPKDFHESNSHRQPGENIIRSHHLVRRAIDIHPSTKSEHKDHLQMLPHRQKRNNFSLYGHYKRFR